jgi:hypothetical protein
MTTMGTIHMGKASRERDGILPLLIAGTIEPDHLDAAPPEVDGSAGNDNNLDADDNSAKQHE